MLVLAHLNANEEQCVEPGVTRPERRLGLIWPPNPLALEFQCYALASRFAIRLLLGQRGTM
jgi:hypothetical protein